MLRMKRPSSSHIPPSYLFDRPVAFGSELRGSSTLAWQALLFANQREGAGILPQERVRASRPPDGPRVQSSDGRPATRSPVARASCASCGMPWIGLESPPPRRQRVPLDQRAAVVRALPLLPTDDFPVAAQMIREAARRG